MIPRARAAVRPPRRAPGRRAAGPGAAGAAGVAGDGLSSVVRGRRPRPSGRGPRGAPPSVEPSALWQPNDLRLVRVENSEIIHDSTSDFVVLPCVLHTGVPFPVSITTHYQASTTPTCYSCTTPYALWRLGRATSHLSNGSEMEPSLRAGGTAPLSEAKVGTDPTRAW